MRTLIFQGGPMGAVYRSSGMAPWPKGEPRELLDSEAQRLLEDFDCFEEAISPDKDDGRGSRDSRTAAQLIKAVSSGEEDSRLFDLLDVETRRTVIRAIESRLDTVESEE